MTAMMRPYQSESVAAIRNEWANGVNSTMIELPTGTGKTEVFVEIMRTWEDPLWRCLVVAPAIALISQAAKKVRQRTGIMPDIEQADNWSNESEWGRNAFVVGSKQTLTKERKGKTYRYQRLQHVGLVIVDECHYASTKPYKEMLDWFKARGAKVLGVTATPKRHDGKAMAINFDTCAYQYGIVDAVKDGWLVNAVTHCVQLKTLNLSKVKSVKDKQTGEVDFKDSELNAEMEHDETVLEVADVTARESGKDKTVVYCASVDQAQLIAERLVDNYGLKAGWICADEKRCTKQRRKEVLESFTQDPEGIQIVCNVGILTVGWDYPALMHIVMAKPTKSLSLYTQIFGRGTRPLEGTVDFEGSTPELRVASIATSKKPFFRMTDLVDNSMQHKIITAVDVLGGNMSLEVKERAKKEAQGAPQTVDEALAAAAKAIREEAEEEERKRRALVVAQTEYAKVRVDPFDQYSKGVGTQGKAKSGARMPFGKFSGKLIADIPDWYLKGTTQDKPKISATWLKNAIAAEISRRGIKVPPPPAPVVAKPAPMVAKFDDANNALYEAAYSDSDIPF